MTFFSARNILAVTFLNHNTFISKSVALRYQNIHIGDFVIPVQAMDALPYILTVVILAGFVGKAIPPRAGGEPYVKER